MYRMLGLSRLFPHSPRFDRYNMTFLDENELAEIDSVVGAFMLVRTAAIRRAGLLDVVGAAGGVNGVLTRAKVLPCAWWPLSG